MVPVNLFNVTLTAATVGSLITSEVFTPVLNQSDELNGTRHTKAINTMRSFKC